MATELEIKYAVDGLQRMDRIFCDPLLCDRMTERYRYIQMQTTYFDTEDGALSDRKWTLRVRQENDKSVVTLKTPAGGLARNEWAVEAETLEDAAEPLIAQGAPKELRTILTDSTPMPLCGAKFVRIAVILALSDKTRCEACGDMGDLFAGGRQEPLCELEFELIEGDEEELLAFGAMVAGKYGLQIEHKSKFARARALAGR